MESTCRLWVRWNQKRGVHGGVISNEITSGSLELLWDLVMQRLWLCMAIVENSLVYLFSLHVALHVLQ